MLIQVTWIEHTEYDERITHQLYRPLLRSGIAFGAQKWLSNLHRQCELFASIMSSGGDNSGTTLIDVFRGNKKWMLTSLPMFLFAVVPPSGKKGIVKLAQRMTRAFCSGICSTVDEWEVVQDADNTKLMTRKSSGNSGAPPGVILSASTTEWMPVSPQHLLDFLQDEKTRSHWDVLSQDGPMRSMLRLPKGHNPDNYISILQTSVSLRKK